MIVNNMEPPDDSVTTLELEEEDHTSIPRSSLRLRDRKKIRILKRYQANLVETTEPETYEEVISRKDSAMWLKAMRDELDAHRKNRTWKLSVLPDGKATIGCRWVFKIKDSNPEEEPRYKDARFCAKGFSQKAGIDYKEIFAPVVRYESIRTLLAIAAECNLELKQFDVKTAFLHGELCEDIYMDISNGLEVAKSGQVLKLLKSLYRLKQASHQWNNKFDSFLKYYPILYPIR